MTTKIEWTDRTWNCIRGCSLVSQGCKHCYAMRQAHRFGGPGMPYEGLTVLNATGPTWTGKVVCDESKLEDPLHWKKPCMVFVNSMSDLFHEDVPESFILACFTTMRLAQQHKFQILTKRPERMLEIIGRWKREGLTLREGHGCELPNVWLGVSVEDQKTADERIPLLLQTPAALRWVSYEPALGPVTFEFLHYNGICEVDSMRGTHGVIRPHGGTNARIDWLVCGGESGPGARPFDLDWARDVREQCTAAGVPFFMKQAGANVYDPSLTASGRSETVHYRDRKGGDMQEWPHDLRVREYPR
jgi:protein gp37